jgi:hypothetical protein
MGLIPGKELSKKRALNLKNLKLKPDYIVVRGRLDER